jgi:hypothetical protein
MPDAVFRELLFQPVELPWKTRRLERDSVADYRLRPVAAQPSVAELWHEAAKLWPERMPELATGRLDAETFRAECLRRRTAAAAATPAPPGVALPARAQALLAEVGAQTEPSLYYAVELRTSHGGELASHDVHAGTRSLVKHLDDASIAALQAAIALVGPPPAHDAVVFVIGSFARNDLLLGPRGHRRTLLEAGQVVGALLLAGRQLSVRVEVVHEFTDRAVDSILEVDGVEEATLAVLVITA